MSVIDSSSYVCYIISNGNNRSYIGSTNDPKRRIRQHNEEISGGAKFTRGRGPWHYVCMVQFSNPTEAVNRSRNLSLEWHMKHPFGKRNQPRGLAQRINALSHTFRKPQFEQETFVIYTDSPTLFSSLNNNVHQIQPINQLLSESNK